MTHAMCCIQPLFALLNAIKFLANIIIRGFKAIWKLFRKNKKNILPVYVQKCMIKLTEICAEPLNVYKTTY